ncbi:hypothetical protein L249_5689 [Ophiocordyceps polyrhachis-furcata BCC 54312]|uniref:Mechanosensitive ion channel protein n=1 Tax=Ophiocordyceps polyrhachis-furcata BCC 54312 TaxID=1330021 RepID=A0A367L033_9HYPO|nr:hypothetical protein L249_5689 [Ophiocordyceps polyrhachis-furcata BCC 54312]
MTDPKPDRPQFSCGESIERPPSLSRHTTTSTGTVDYFPDIGSRLPPSGQRMHGTRAADDLEILRVQRSVTGDVPLKEEPYAEPEPEPEDETVDGEDTKRERKDNALFRLRAMIHSLPRFLRYLVYLIPGGCLLLIPVLLGYFQTNPDERLLGGVGGVELMWFGIWLEITWCSLWLSRLLMNILPPLFFGCAWIMGSPNTKQWKEFGRRLEVPAAVFLWFLSILISFKNTLDGHHASPPPDSGDDDPGIRWVDVVNKVIIALFILATLNFLEKIVIQWIATSFHRRTYSTRIENNKADVRQLAKLYEYAKIKLNQGHDRLHKGGPGVGGSATTLQTLHENARQVIGKVGQVAGKVGNDLIGRKVNIDATLKVVTQLLRSTPKSYTLARFIFRSLVRSDRETVYADDLKAVFQTKEEVDAAFNVFDKDLNGDISLGEFEAVCNEIHLETKAIAASLKDLDSVIHKLDRVFLFIIVIIAAAVFVVILSGSAAAGLASIGSTVLGLAWMLQATAQEFLQSIIFVFIKHPFDVGDRVTVYGSTGAKMKGDEYYVTEISLLYTEFKKMQGHIVQAPNSILNTLFILNHRRSNGTSDPVLLEMRFGTPVEQINELKRRMVDFCLRHKRDYHPTVVTEMLHLDEVKSCSMNLVVKHKGNFQSESLRQSRHNKLVTEIMHQMILIGIEGPSHVEPGGSPQYPIYWAGVAPPPPPPSPPPPPHPPHPPRPAATPLGGEGPSMLRSGASLRVPELSDDGVEDVFENRRERTMAQRIASIRKKERGLRSAAESGSAEASSSVARSASRVSTHQHQGSRERRPTFLQRSLTMVSAKNSREPPV